MLRILKYFSRTRQFKEGRTPSVNGNGAANPKILLREWSEEDRKFLESWLIAHASRALYFRFAISEGFWETEGSFPRCKGCYGDGCNPQNRFSGQSSFQHCKKNEGKDRTWLFHYHNVIPHRQITSLFVTVLSFERTRVCHFTVGPPS